MSTSPHPGADPKPLLFALYEQASVGCGGAPSLWTHPADERLSINSLSYWSNLARIADQANLDMLFFADVLGFYDGYGGKADAALKWAVEAPANDPLMIIPALAAVTENLAFGVTVTPAHPAADPGRLVRARARVCRQTRRADLHRQVQPAGNPSGSG